MFGLSILDLLILLLYFLVITAIGLISTYWIKNREDFIMGGRRFGKAMMVMFSFGAGTHADNAVGVSAQSYKVGFAGIWYQWVMLFTLPIYWLLAPIYRRARVLTTADLFERRFGTGFMLLYSGFALYYNLVTTSIMLYGSSQLLEALMNHTLSWKWIILILAGLSFFYGIAGGLIAAVWNDFFQGILTIVMSILIIPFFWSKIGGLEGFQSHLADPQQTFRLVLSQNMTLYWIIMMTVAMLLSMVTQPHIMANTAAAKTEMDSRVGFTGGLLLKRLITVPWALTGVMALALYGAGTADPDHIFGTMCRDLLPAGFVGLMLACVMASMMDNCSVLMLCFAGIYTNSFHKKWFQPNASESQLVTAGRWSSVAFAAVSTAGAYLFQDITEALRFSFQTTPLIGITFFFAILWPRANRYGAIAAYVTAIGGLLISRFIFDWEGDYGLPRTTTLYLAMSLAAGVLVSLLTRPEPQHKTNSFFLLLKTPIGQEHVLRSVGFQEIPGTGTFEPPAEDAPAFDYKKILETVNRSETRRQGWMGVLGLSVIVIVMLISVKWLASWLGNG